MAAITRTIRLRKRLVRIHTPRRLKKSIDYLREDIARHAKAEVSAVSLSKELNGYMMDKVARRMKPVTVTVEKVDGVVKVDLIPELKRKPKMTKPVAAQTAAAAKGAPAAKSAAAQQKPNKPAKEAKPQAPTPQRGMPVKKPETAPANMG